jgi:type II secretory pathway component PulF
LAGKDGSSSFQRYLTKVGAAVKVGQDLASAMALDTRYFDDWTINLIRLAQYSGSLAETFERLAIAAEVQQRRERLIRSVRLRAIAIIWCLLVICTILWSQGNVLLQFSFWLNSIGLALLLVGLSILASRYRGRWLVRLVAGLPGLGKLMQVRSLLYFAELELPLSCGISLLAALDLVRSRIPDPVMAAKLAKASQQLRIGHTLSHSLQGKLPPLAIQMIRTGEETGNLDAAFHNLAEYYEGELERAIRQLEGVMRPLSILAMGGLVALLSIRAIASLINSLPG